jgi:hypothetical protein
MRSSRHLALFGAVVAAAIGCGSSDRPLRPGDAAGDGGRDGFGGGSAVGGTGGAGAAGHGGSDAGTDAHGADAADADGAESCQQLMSDYTRALVPAFACTVDAPNQCQQRSLALSCTGCYLLAQTTTTLDALRGQLLAQGCVSPGDCPCISPGNPVCVPVDAGPGQGTCGFPVN